MTNFFEDRKYENDKNKWLTECKICAKPKRPMNKIGLTPNYTRHARKYHKDQYMAWIDEVKKNNQDKLNSKITNHFSKRNSPHSL